MPAGIFLVPKDLQQIEGHRTYTGAWKSYRQIVISLGKKPNQKITILEYCSHENVHVNEVLNLFGLQQQHYQQSTLF